MASLIEIAATAIGAVLTTGGIGAFAFKTQVQKLKAEIARQDADTGKIGAETQVLLSRQLLAELERITENNDDLQRRVDAQARELDSLRAKIVEYIRREQAHAVETASLRQRIAELESGTGLSAILRAANPPIIEHIPGEFDAPAADSNSE